MAPTLGQGVRSIPQHLVCTLTLEGALECQTAPWRTSVWCGQARRLASLLGHSHPCTGDGAMGRQCGHSTAPRGGASLCFSCSAGVVGLEFSAA